MLKGDADGPNAADNIISELGDHALTKSHARHLSATKCQSIGLKVRMLEDEPPLQDAVLSVHHAYIHTLASTIAFKIIENHKGVAFIQAVQTVMMPASVGREQGQIAISFPERTGSPSEEHPGSV